MTTAAGSARRDANHVRDPPTVTAGAGDARDAPAWGSRLAARVDDFLAPVPRPAWLGALVVLGSLEAAGIAYLVSVNQQVAPQDVAVMLRIAAIMLPIAAGSCLWICRIHVRMGILLIGEGAIAAIWLLDGSSNSLAFSVGELASGIAPPLVCYLMLAHPSGRLRAGPDRRLLTVTGGFLALVWAVCVVTSGQPPFKTALLRCGPHCPSNSLFLGSTPDAVTSVLAAVGAVMWLALAWGTWVLVSRRARAASAPLRRSLAPVKWTAFGYAAFVTTAIALQIGALHPATIFGSDSLEVAIILPLAVLCGIGLERLSMGRVLADFVTALELLPSADPQALMAVALRDSSLRIGYRTAEEATWLDASGARVDTDRGRNQAVTWVRRDDEPLAAVVHDAELCDLEPFFQAAGAAAAMRLEQRRLDADLRASTADLVASRDRLVEAAYSERQRIERDLHDSVQQDLVGLRIRLDLAAEVLKEDPAQGDSIIASVGRQLDDVLETVRSLARGIYPALLDARGLGEALRSAALRCPRPVSVNFRGLGRCAPEVELAVYFCCLEALQNVVKHAGPNASAEVRLWQESGQLHFEIRDNGVGFAEGALRRRHGLINMHDRIEAVGGKLLVHSRSGRGTSVIGTVSVAEADADSVTARLAP